MLLGLPAPWMLGPLLAGLAFGCAPLTTPAVSKKLFNCGQAVVGIVVAGAIHPSFIGVVATHWWLMALVLCSTVAAAGGAAWFLSRGGTLDVLTATMG